MCCNKTTAGLHFTNRHISPEVSKLPLITCLTTLPNIFLFWGRINSTNRTPLHCSGRCGAGKLMLQNHRGKVGIFGRKVWNRLEY